MGSSEKSFIVGNSPKIREMSMGRDSLIMAALTFLSKILGFVRNFIYGILFGGVVSLGADAFSAANSLPSSVWLMLGSGTLNAVLVPAIVKASKDRDGGVDYISRIVSLVLVLSIGMTVVSMILSPLLLTLINGKLPEKTFELAMIFSLVLLPQLIFFALIMVFSQILNAFNYFASSMWAPAINNIVSIIGMGAFLLTVGSTRQWDSGDWSLQYIMAIGSLPLAGSFFQALYLYLAMWKNGIRAKLIFKFRGIGLRKLGEIGFWTILSTVLGQISVWSVRWAAGSGVKAAERARSIGESDQMYAGYASLDYSYTVFIMAQSIFVVSIVTAVFPKISRNVIDRDYLSIRSDLKRVSGLINVFLGFSTVAIIVFSPTVMWIAIGGTGREAGFASGLVLSAYALSLIPISLNYLVRRYFYAKEDALSVFLMQIPVTAIAVIGSLLSFIFAPPQYSAVLGVMSLTVGSVFGMVVSLSMLKNSLEGFKKRILFEDFWKIALSSAATFAGGFSIYYYFQDQFWTGRVQGLILLGVSSILILGLYCGVLEITRCKPWLEMRKLIFSRFSKGNLKRS